MANSFNLNQPLLTTTASSTSVNLTSLARHFAPIAHVPLNSDEYRLKLSVAAASPTRTPSPSIRADQNDGEQVRRSADQKSDCSFNTSYCSSPEMSSPSEADRLHSRIQSLQSLRYLYDTRRTKPAHGSPVAESATPDDAGKASSDGSPVSATPHGIEHILSRPRPSAPPSHQYAAPMPGVAQASASLANGLASHHQWAGVYWPPLPGFIGNPAAIQAWRERLSYGNQNFDALKTHFSPATFSNCSRNKWRQRGRRSRRQEKAHAPDVQRPADFRAREDVRANKVPRRSRASQTGLRTRHD